jgi:hypothetical protein
MPFDFLFLDANARPAALGGACTALAADASSLLYNPAGLARVTSHDVTFMHNAYMQGIDQEYAAYASPEGWSSNLNYLSFGDVQKTTLSNPDGTGLGETTLTDLAFGAGYGFPLSASLSAGVGVKYIRETIDDVTEKGFALDAGGLYEVSALRGLSLGLVLQNFDLDPGVRFKGKKETLPLNLRAGAAYSFRVHGHENMVSLDVTKGRRQDAQMAAGGETQFLGPLVLRFGFTTRNDAGIGITAGFGYLFKAWSIDYAFVPMGDIGNAHRISMTLHWL